LQAIALGFSDKTPEIKTEIVYLGSGLPEEYDGKDVSGKIVLVSNDAPVGKEHPLRCEAIRTAFSKGAKAVLFINDKIGMLNLAGVADFQDKPSPIPGFSLTMEEGLWLKRLLNDKESVIVNIKTESQCKPSESANIIYTLPGKSKKKIVLTAHFDSWDLSQGTVDNGYGTAILFDVCRILKNYDHNNYYTIEFAWVNGEELGLIGSGKYVEMHANDSIIANINMDMTGTPTGFNALGFDELVPFLKNIADSLKGFDFSDGVTSQPWLGSDQESFFLKGIPAITLNAYLDKDMYWWYHDAGDTFDKARKKMLSDAAAVVSVLTYELANNTSLHCPVYSEDNVIKFLKKFNLDKQLKKQMLWNFGE
jgi:hypothetical protein